MTPGSGSSLKGISTHINGRHAFVHERVLELVARETELRGSVMFAKADLAKRMGCTVQTLDRAVRRLCREGLIERKAVFSDRGSQLGNEYHATPDGLVMAQHLKRHPHASDYASSLSIRS